MKLLSARLFPAALALGLVSICPAQVIFAVVNSGTFLGGANSLSPGVAASIFGMNLAVAGNNLVVTLGGANCDIFFQSPGQLNIGFPINAPVGPSSVIVSHDGGISAPFGVTVDAYAPGLFRLFNPPPDPPALGLFLSGNTLIRATNPANTGDTLDSFGTGLGATSLIPPFATLKPTSVSVGGQAAVVLSSVGFTGPPIGGVQGYRTRFIVPVGLAPGNHSVTWTIEGITSPALVPTSVGFQPLTLPIGCRDITSQVTVSPVGPLILNRGRATYQQRVQVKTLAASSFVQATLLLVNLTPGVALSNAASGVCPPSTPTPNTELTFGAPGTFQTANETLLFAAPNANIQYGVRVLAP